MDHSSDNNTSILTQGMGSLSSRVLSGSLFYSWSPSATIFAKVEDVPNYVDRVSNKIIIIYITINSIKLLNLR